MAVARIVRPFLTVAALALMLLLGVAAGLSWRLSQGPLSLVSLQPWLERLAARGSPFAVRFADPALAFSARRGTFALTVKDLELKSRTGQLVLQAPLAGIRVDAAALLLQQALVPVELAVDLPRMDLVRLGPRRVELSFAGRLATLPLARATGGEGLASLLAGAPEAGDPRLQRLRSIRVAAPILHLADAPSGRELTARAAELGLERGEAGWRADLVAALGDDAPPLGRAVLSLAPGPGGQQVGLALDRVPAATLAELVPGLPPGALQGRVSGRVEAGLGLPALEPGPGRFRLTATGLSLRWPERFGGPLDVERAGLAGEIAAGWQAATVREAEIVSGPTRLAGTADLMLDGPTLRLEAALEAEGLDAATVGRFWPLWKGVRARAWFLGHVRGGWASQARLGLTAPLPWLGGEGPPVASLAFGFGGATITWLDGMMPAEGVGGEALLTPSRLDFSLRSGRVGEVALDRGTLAIEGIDQPGVPPRLGAELHLAGPLRSALAVLDGERLRLPSKAGIDPARTSGQARGRLDLRLPLRRGLEPREVGFAIDATLQDAGLTEAFRGLAAEAGEIRLAGDQAGLEARGAVRVGGAPWRLHWQERFARGGPWRRQVAVEGKVDAAAAGRLAAPWPAFLGGEAGLSATLTVPWQGARRVGFALDLTPATVDLPSLGLAKPAGTAGRATGRAVLPEPGRIDLEALGVELPGLALEAAAGLGTDPPDWRRLELVRLRLGGSDLSAQLVKHEDGTIAGLAQGRRLDLRPWRARLGSEGGGGGPPLPPLDLAVSADELYLADVPLRAVAGRLERTAQAWRTIRLGGRLEGGAEAGLDYRGDERGGEAHVRAEDGGRLLEALGFRQKQVEGGRLRLDAGMTLASGRVAGELSLQDFTLLRSPFMARLLSLATFQGIANALSGEGIPMARLTVPFVWGGHTVEIEDARLLGSEMGARASGTVDLAARTLRLDGTIAPAYSLNWALGQVPIVGQIMRGQDADAALAATFSARGDLAAPEITVNPLAALVPGAIRDLFRDLGSDAPSAPLERDRQ